MSATFAPAVVSTSIASGVILTPRLSIPASVTRAQSKELIRQLFGTDANAFASASSIANFDAFVSRCTALALSAAIFGDSSRLQRMSAYLVSIDAKKDKDGAFTGRIGKLYTAYSEAVTIGQVIGKSLDSAIDIVDLSVLDQSPLFGALIAPVVPVPKAIPAAQKAQKAQKAVEPSHREINESTKDEAPKEAAPIDPRMVMLTPSVIKEKARLSALWKSEAEALRLELEAEALADKLALQLVELRQAQLERLAARHEEDKVAIIAFVELANRFGLKLTKAQLAALDVVEKEAAAA